MSNIPINSIVIPDRFVTLCCDWYGGQSCLLYAVSSTGGLTTGTRLPYGCDTDEQWYLSIWRDLAADVWVAVCAAKSGCNACDDGGDGDGHDVDYPALVEFEAWVDSIVERIESAYALSDWARA